MGRNLASSKGSLDTENVLGTPLASSPDVPPIEPDTRGATTIREQPLHREMIPALIVTPRSIPGDSD